MQLNLEQKKMVQMEPSGHNLIKGVAGSGKTTVAVHRIPYLMKHYCHEKDDRILMLTFNKTLLNYIKYIYNKVDDVNDQISISELVNNVNVDIKTIDSIVYAQYMKMKNDGNTKIASQNDKFKLMSRAIQIMSEREKTHKIVNQNNGAFLIDEIEWIDACLIETVEDYQQLDRVGRASNIVDKTPQKLLKNSDLRSSIFALKEVYLGLMTHEKLTDFKVMNKLALTAPIKESEKYTHILIDEGQDLTRAQLEMIKRIYKQKNYSSMTFIVDNAQSIYPHSWLGKGRSYTTIGFDMSGKSRTLSKNYRTTTQISEAAYSLLEKDENLKLDMDFVKPSLVDRNGSYPIYSHYLTLKEELENIKKNILELHTEYSFSDICIIARGKRITEEAQLYLEKENIPCTLLNKDTPDFESETVKVSTIHSVKGLEFKVVMIIAISEGILPYASGMTEDDNKLLESDERKLLYVGMTRANDLLYLSSHKKPSRFIKEINNSFLRFRKDCCLKPIYPISVSDYIKKNQIIDLYSQEEAIRQWILHELIHSYKYPESMIEVEYPVTTFSRKGYADIVVSVCFQGKKVPFILAELKKYRSGIEDAEKQAVSYMQSLDTVRYGLVTDGFNLKIFDREIDSLDDIPRFSNSMLPDTVERYSLKSLRSQCEMIYERDCDDVTLITLKNRDSEITVEFDQTADIQVYGDIVAGVPKDVNVEMKDHFILPISFMIQPSNTFMLEVIGDSMLDAGIDIGDYVIVNKQSAADNGQIIVAYLDGAATLKRFMQMGDSVLLIPENSRYEPINIKPDQLIINGVVVGILKKLSRNC